MCRIKLLILATLALIAPSLRAAEAPLRVINDPNGRASGIEATGWSKNDLANLTKPNADLSEILRDRLGICVLNDQGQPQLPAIGGSYQVVGEAIRFTPQYPLRPGMSYQAFVRPVPSTPAGSAAPYTLNITIPAPIPAPPTRVTAIYPSSSALPENQLRFYIHFSAPMASGDAYSHVKLIKANGQVVDRAFLEVSGELWDGSGQRLTVLLDPGRVKKGLQPRQELGPVLEAGQRYRLVVDNGLRDADGRPLVTAFEKKFVAGPAVESAVDVKQWKVIAPRSGTREALVLQFPRPLDRALLMRMITVADAGGREIAGEITLADEERRWEFCPDQPWSAGQFDLVADTALEDSAGNNIARPFEIDVFDRVDEKPGPDFAKIPFSVR